MMPRHPTAQTPPPPPPPPPPHFSDDNQKPDIQSIRTLVTTINQHMHAILKNTQSVKALTLKCTSKLSNIQTHDQSFEFSAHSAVSNLYWGIVNADSASESKCAIERIKKLDNSEKMLQVPASLDENGYTMGIPNSYLLCSAYFYLSVVEFLRGDTWQVAMHFLHAVSVSPRLVCGEFAPGIFRSLLPLLVDSDFDDVMVGDDDVMRWMARRYKPWLMYYQIMSRDHENQCTMNRFQRSRSLETQCLYEHRSGLRTNHHHLIEKMHPHNLQESITYSVEEEKIASYSENRETKRGSNIKCLKDILTESDSDTSAVEDVFPDQNYEDIDEITPPRIGRTNAEASRSLCISRSFSTPRQLHCKSLKMNNSSNLQQEESELLEEEMISTRKIYEILNSKSGPKYPLIKDVILDQLLISISSSKEEKVVRTSMSILSTIVTSNRSLLDDIKRKGLQLYDLATALKRKVHEAVILIYLINPSPLEIKTLELLPCLVEVVCSSTSRSCYKMDLASILLTPPAASLMIIEVLLTNFDYEMDKVHLAEISSRRVISRLVKVPRKDNVEEFISLASVLVKCMRFDGKCRKYIYEFCEVDRFVSLLWSKEKRATNIALEFFDELHKMPRSSSVGLLENIRKYGCVNNIHGLFLLMQKSQSEYKLLAANLLLQLEVLENTSEKCMYSEEAAKALLESLTCDESPEKQVFSAFILSNLGGTYSWTGEPYTTAWLVKKTVLPSANHRNLIKNYDFLDQCLQDGGIDLWCSKIGQRMLHIGEPVFRALKKGLNSKSKRVSRDCLIAISWLGCEIVKVSDEVRNAACEIVLPSIEQFVHPGFELEERLLACLCIYNYTSGRGMKRIISLSEGVRESLRRLSNVTWMAEELLKVADYYQPNKWRISCVHSQILEAGNKCNGAVTALIYYRGLLCSGYTDGSIKVWDIKGQRATLVQEIKEHKKTVTCFALYEPGNCLLSGSSDKTIKMWQMNQRNLECIEVITVKESIRSIDSWGESIFATTQSHKLKVIDGSRKTKDVFKNKRVKCLNVSQGKVYAGCTDSSIQELMIVNNRHQEMKPPSKSWMQSKPITSVSVYKDWLYSASLTVEGSKIKDWRRGNKPQVSITAERGASVVAMEVVEDFIYLNCSTSMSSIQIWLRGTQQRVGRLSGGSKITSLLTANDMILCGTEKGVIKGWIPL